MKNFSQIIANIKNAKSISAEDFTVSAIEIDSRKCKQNSIFVAIKGEKLNGESFIESAIKLGAKAILVEQNYSSPLEKNINYIFAENIADTTAEICKNFYTPKPENLIAVTGTNGKTSVANFCAKILTKLNTKSAAIGTLGICYGGEFPEAPEASLTTPDVISLHKILQNLKTENIDYIAFEASSHGLEQKRVSGLNVIVAGYTNLTQDHLDYHKTFENYFLAKQKLFSEVLPEGAIAVLNSDDSYFERLQKTCLNRNIKVISYGKNADIKLKNFTSHNSGQSLEINAFGKDYSINTNLIGSFQSYNLLCAIGMIYALGFELEKIIAACENINSVRGRMEVIATHKNATILVDYAHTPDALEKAILAIRPHVEGRLITLFGCGGDRDKTKRPLMANIACKNSDLVIITDDNPRTENAAEIRQDIIAGVEAEKNYIEINGRLEAINQAISMLRSGDILLLAGKGHEDYQIIGTEKLPFNEVEIVKNIIENL